MDTQNNDQEGFVKLNKKPAQAAFITLSAALLKDVDHLWTADIKTYDISHPFDPEQDGDFIIFYGFYSDGISHFLSDVCRPSNLNQLKRVIFWMLPASNGDQERFDIWAEARGEYASFLMAGMTNYSGAGGHDYNLTRSALAFIAALFGLEIEERRVEWLAARQGWAGVNEQIKAQLASEEGGEE